VVLWLAAFASIAAAQNEAMPPPKDTIFARKIVMATIDVNMDEVETMLAQGGKLDMPTHGSIWTSSPCC